MSKMPEKLCLCILLARPASPLGWEQVGRFTWCRQVTLDIPGVIFSPQCPPSWANCLETTESLCQERGVSHPQHPALAPSVAKQMAAPGPLPSPLPLFRGCAVKGRWRQHTQGSVVEVTWLQDHP